MGLYPKTINNGEPGIREIVVAGSSGEERTGDPEQHPGPEDLPRWDAVIDG